MSLPQNPQHFDELPISKVLKRTLAAGKYVDMKPIQSEAIPHLLAGRNVLGASPTGSGKTLAFLIPAIEMLSFSRARPSDGVLVVVLSPARELALQTFSVARDLMKSSSQTVGMAIGSTTYKDEAYQLSRKGFNMLIATPGRLRQHLREGNIKHDNFQMLIIDEADRMLENNFADDLYEIFKILGAPKQTALFSATLTRDVEGLMRVNISSQPVFCCPAPSQTVATLDHCYTLVPIRLRIAYLIALLKRLKGNRIVVFTNSRKEAEFLSLALNALDIDNECLRGEMEKRERTLSFVTFNRDEKSVLIATNVAARGLDFQGVDWSISLGPPDRVKDYIHRAGRTARNEKFGRSLLILAENEKPFVQSIRRHKIRISHVNLKLKRVEEELENLRDNIIPSGETFEELAEAALNAFKNSYMARPVEEGISIEGVDNDDLRQSFGLKANS